jgi:transcriptional regulator with XRE-family HTH domain
VVRASRKAQKIRQDDAAGSIGVSENFLGKVERGSAFLLHHFTSVQSKL